MAFFKNGALVELIETTATSGGTTVLINTSKTYQAFTGTSNQTVRLPNATTMQNGQRFEIINDGTGLLTIQYNDASTADTIEAGKSKMFMLFDNSTSNGSFDITTGSSAGASVSEADVASVRAGQLGSFSQTSDNLKFEPEEVGGDAWVNKASIISVTQFPAPFNLNGYMYGAGGFIASASALVSRYDDINNYWLSRTNLSTARWTAGSFALSGFGYAMGGQVSGNSGISSGEKYDDSLNSWSATATLAQAAANSFAFAVSNYGFLAGGNDSGSSIQSVTQMFDSANNSWSLRAPLPANQTFGQGSSVNDYGYAVAGDNGSPTNVVRKFNNIVNGWVTVASTASTGQRCLSSSANGLLYKMGGAATGTGLEEYFDAANAWKARANIPTSVASTYAGSINGYMYILGTGGATTVQQYRNFNILLSSIRKRVTAAPTNMYVAAKVGDLVVKVPALIRTNGNEWKLLESNSDSGLKLNESFKAKFVENGLLYIAGGNDSGGTQSATTEYYNPSANTWTNRQSLITARTDFASFPLNGYAYSCGGGTPSGATALVERFDDVANATLARQSFSQTRTLIPGFFLKGFGYVPGGNNGGSVGSLTEKYNDSTNTWSSVASLPASVARGAGVSMLERGVYAGGSTTGGGGSVVANVYTYLDITDAWTTRTSLSTGRYVPGRFSLNGYSFVLAGLDNGNTRLSSVERYDDQANSWSNRASLAQALESPGGSYAEGYGYQHGGYNGSAFSGTAQYNDGANTWTSKANLNLARYNPSNGFTPGAYRNYEVRVGLPAYLSGSGAGVWVSAASMNLAREQLCHFSLNNFAYRVGGFNGSTQSDTEKYLHDLDVWVRHATQEQTRAQHTAFSLQGFGYVAHGSPGTAAAKLDDVVNTWTAIATTARSSNNPAAFPLNGFGYTFLGSTNGMEQYNPATNAWANKTSATSRQLPGGFALKGYGYSVGGESAYIVQRYNDQSNAWTTVANTGSNVSQMPAYSIGDKGYFAGGTPNGSTASAFGRTEEYNPDANTWSLKNSFSTARIQHGSGVYEDKAIIFGGRNTGSSIIASAERYIPSLNNLILSVALETD